MILARLLTNLTMTNGSMLEPAGDALRVAASEARDFVENGEG